MDNENDYLMLKDNYKAVIQSMRTMQDESYLFQGWRRKIEGSNLKENTYRKIITNLKNEITSVENIIQQMNSICKEVMASSSLQVTINSFPSFTRNINEAAEFIQEFVYDPDLTKQPAVLICPLNISHLRESKTINLRDCSDLTDIHITNHTRSKVLPQVSNCIKRNEEDEEIKSTHEEDEEIKSTYEEDKEIKSTYEEDEEIKSTYEEDEEIKSTCEEDDLIFLDYEDHDNNDVASDVDVAQVGTSNVEMVDDGDFLNDSVVKTEIKYDYNSATELPEEMYNFQHEDFETKAKIVVDKFFSAITKVADNSQIISGLQRKFICDYCQRPFLQKPTLKRHILICSKRNDGFKHVKVKQKIVDKNKYECKLCKSKFASKKSIDKHNERTHNLKRPFKCLVCSWGFFNEEALQVHCSTRHGLSEYKQYRCPYCKYSFGKRSELNYHCRKDHKTSTFYNCSFCYESFSDESVFKDHEQSHGFRCDVCMFVTKSKSELTAHRTTHLQLVVYSCKTCARTFNKKREFSKHINRHEREKRFNALSPFV